MTHPAGGITSGTMAADVKSVRNALNRQRGHFANKVRSAESMLDVKDADIANPLVQDLLRSALQTIEDQHEKMEVLFDRMYSYELPVESKAKVDDMNEAVEKEYNGIRARIVKVLVRGPVHPAPQPNPPQGPRVQQPKIQPDMKPARLATGESVAGFKAWQKKFAAFFTMSHLQQADIGIQQTALCNCLEQDVERKLRVSMKDDTPIFGNGGVIEMLETEVMRSNPLNLRRHKFFLSRQKKGEKFTDWVAQLDQLARDADIAELDFATMMVYRWITGCDNDELRGKFLREANPTMETLMAVAHTFEATNATVSGLKGSASANQAKGRDKSRGRSKSRSKANAVTSSSKHCFRCGSQKHVVSGCTVDKDSLTCGTCGKKGHVSKVCFSDKKRGGDRGRSRQRGGDRGRSPSRSPSPRPSGKSILKGANANYVTHRCAVVQSGPGEETPSFRCMMTQLETGVSFSADCIPDTGATRTIVQRQLLERHKIKWQPSTQQISTANGGEMDVSGEIKLQMRYQGKSIQVNALVSADLAPAMLVSWRDLQDLDIVPGAFPARMGKACSAASKESASQPGEDAFARLRRKMIEEFPAVLRDEVGDATLAGGPMTIYIDDAKAEKRKPLHVSTTRPTPIHMKEEAKKLLDEYLASGIIEPVPDNEPTEWCSRAHFVPKPDGRVRLVVDLRELNAVVRRPVHPFPSTRDILRSLDPTSKVFAKVDAVAGYHQVMLHEESRHYTTFLLESGRYRFCRAPMGLSSSGDEFCHRTDQAFNGVPGTMKIVDDGITGAKTIEELERRLTTLFMRCQQYGVVLSLRKFKIGDSLKFAGHVISSAGVKPDPDKVAALAEYAPPTNVSELRGFLGLANQLGSFLPDLAHVLAPLRPLLKKENAYLWLHEHQVAFEEARKTLSGDMLVKPFDPSLRTELYTDASRLHGLGYMLMQRESDGSPRVITCGSRGLTPTEQRYATTELEALGIYYACTHAAFYLVGGDFVIYTDHKPLIGLFAKPLADVTNVRVARYREKLQHLTMQLEWVAGKDHQVADALSRAPLFAPPEDVEEKEDTTQVLACFAHAAFLDPSLDSMVNHDDADYIALVRALECGLDADDLPEALRPHAANYESYSLVGRGKHKLVIDDMRRIVVPSTHRKRILKLLHAGHCGVIKTYKLASSRFTWPGMRNSITQMTDSCDVCRERQPSQQREAPIEPRVTEFPMSDVGCDLFALRGKDYLVMVDRYSGYPLVQKLGSTTTQAICGHLTRWFSLFGIPCRIRTDGGPQFRQPFAEYCEQLGIKHELASAFNPESNGLSEAGVKQVKRLLDKTIDADENFDFNLLQYRNTPKEDGSIPAALFFHREQRTLLPSVEGKHKFLKSTEMDQMHSKRLLTQRKSLSTLLDRSAGHRDQFTVGERVYVQDQKSGLWSKEGKIVGVRESGKSYDLILNGREVVRPRSLLRLKKSIEQECDEPAPPVRPTGEKRLRFRFPGGSEAPSFRDRESSSRSARVLFSALIGPVSRTTPSRSFASVLAVTQDGKRQLQGQGGGQQGQRGKRRSSQRRGWLAHRDARDGGGLDAPHAPVHARGLLVPGTPAARQTEEDQEEVARALWQRSTLPRRREIRESNASAAVAAAIPGLCYPDDDVLARRRDADARRGPAAAAFPASALQDSGAGPDDRCSDGGRSEWQVQPIPRGRREGAPGLRGQAHGRLQPLQGGERRERKR